MQPIPLIRFFFPWDAGGGISDEYDGRYDCVSEEYGSDRIFYGGSAGRWK